MLSLWAQGGPDEELPPLNTKHNTHFEMMSFSLDPQWCGLLFSLYCRHEKGALLSGTGMPQTDVFAISSLPGPPLEADWIAIASSFGFEICHLSSTWALIFESVKATGVILLLGVGSLVCYKICNHYWPRRRPRSRSSFQRHRRDSSPSSHGRNPSGAYVTEDTDAEELLEDLEEGEFNGIEGHYFGPEQAGGDRGDGEGVKDRRDACHCRLHAVNPSHNNTYSGSCAQSVYLSSSTSPSESTTSGEDEGRDADISEGSLLDRLPRHYNVLQNQPAKEQHSWKGMSWSGAKATSPKRASRPTSLDGSFMEHLSQNYSGCLINRINKLITSTPGTLQLSGSAMRKLQLRSSGNTKLNRSGKTPLMKWQKGKTNGLRRTGQSAEKEMEKSSSELSRVDEPWVMQGYSVPNSLRRDESYDSLGFPRRLNRDGSFDSTCSELSMDFSLPSAVDADITTMLRMEKLQEEIDQLKTNCLLMDEEFETIKCNRNLPGMSSLMKANVPDSNLSLTSGNPDKDDTKVEHEIDRVKEEIARKCFTGLYSLTTINHSTSSELSDSYPMVQNDTFAQESIGSAESLAWDSPHLAASPAKLSTSEVESLFSSPVKEMEAITVQSCFSFPEKECYMNETYNLQPNEISEATVLTQSDCELMANLEWDEDGLEYIDDIIAVEEDSFVSATTDDIIAVEEDSFVSATTDDIDASLDTRGRNVEEDIRSTTFISDMKNETSLVDPESAFESMTSSLTASVMTERSSWMESSGFDNESQMVDSCTSIRSSQLASDCEASFGKKKENTVWNCNDPVEWNSTRKALNLPPSPSNSESGTAQQTWEDTSSEISTPASELPLSDMLSPVSSSESSAIGVENVSQRVNLMQYAVREWQGHTKKAETILKGYAEIPSLLGLQYLRRIRGDNYCGVRAAIFQALTQMIPIPTGAKTFQYLSQAVNNKKCEWLQNWNFSGRLPYHGNNVIHGMEVCLQNLDSVVSLLSSCNGNQEDTLAALLNSDPIMDLHIVEAVKLQMLHHAMQLHETSLSGLEVPFFAILMFARDTSETPKDFMNNHLREVGNTGGLEQVEMFLLGYTLGVTIRVVRPSAHGTDDFICSYPDYNEGNLPQIFLIAEDDRHYNVLVN